MTDLESAAIDAAFGQRIQALFATLVTGLATEVNEGEVLRRFTRGLELARKARQLVHEHET